MQVEEQPARGGSSAAAAEVAEEAAEAWRLMCPRQKGLWGRRLVAVEAGYTVAKMHPFGQSPRAHAGQRSRGGRGAGGASPQQQQQQQQQAPNKKGKKVVLGRTQAGAARVTPERDRKQGRRARALANT
jgi:hypothetical protein